MSDDIPAGRIFCKLFIADPVPHDTWLALTGVLEPAAGQQMLHVNERTWSRWHSGAQPVPWAAAELLRRLIGELPPGDRAFKLY